MDDNRRFNYKTNPFTYKLRKGKAIKLDNYIDLAEKYVNILRSDFSSFALINRQNAPTTPTVPGRGGTGGSGIFGHLINEEKKFKPAPIAGRRGTKWDPTIINWKNSLRRPW